MVMGASGHPSVTSPAAYGWSQIFAAAEAAPLMGAVFFACPQARVAINRHRHTQIIFINAPAFPDEPLCRTSPAWGSVLFGLLRVSAPLSKCRYLRVAIPRGPSASKRFRGTHSRPA